MSQKSETYVPRITQLDANEFDKEICSIFTNTIVAPRGNITLGQILTNIEPEVKLLIELLMFKYSLLKKNTSFGQQLLNVQYNDVLTRNKAAWFSLLNFVIPYLKTKYDNASSKWKNKHVTAVVDKLELIVQLCQLLNLMVFLRNGVFPSLVDRLLGLKIVPQTKLSRNVGYSYMTRELIWHGFMELCTFVLPLINFQYFKRLYKNLAFKSHKPHKPIIQQSISFYQYEKCSICRELPVYPCRISLYCGHVACYYCIMSNASVDSKYPCPDCGAQNTVHMKLDTLYIQ